MKDTLRYYQLIAALLDPAKDGASVRKLLEVNSFQWERFVYISSNNLVVPALYLQIQRKGLKAFFPEELTVYMEEITRANRERNLAILQQMERLSECFAKEGIVHVYLKGAAMIGGSYYQDTAERMLRDIDILIAPGEQMKAYQLLQKQGYVEVVAGGLQYKTLSDYERAKHLPALCHPQEIATVELHNHLHNTFQRERLKTAEVIGNAIEAGFPIPAPADLLRHNIYNWHINDFGGIKLDIHFRSAYDTLVLLHKEKGLQPLLHTDGATRQYAALLSPFFDGFYARFNWRVALMKAKLQRPQFNQLWYRVVFGSIRFFQILPSRLRLFMKSGVYRKRVLQVLQKGR
ncbi:nucleotidyltransferase family protein [Phaeodactylibacter xiamenensis]|uniref:nucleotidyltransferase family protein n=1 Tax=Phaeodactylibacter xiamenensis TaxID=1524460 RepID=UPI003CCBD3E3